MANPQKENGFVGVANEIWDEIIRRDFTKRQKDILNLVIRLSYGCGRKAATLPKQQDFTLCGLGGKSHVGGELRYLEECGVIIRDRRTSAYAIVKNYEKWAVQQVGGWDQERFDELVHLNLKLAKAERKKVTETGTLEALEEETESYQNGNFDEVEKLPKQELEVTETGTFTEKGLPKRELEVAETGTLTLDEPSQGAASQSPKKGLKKEDIKESIKENVVSDIVAYLNERANKRFSPKTTSTKKHINARLEEGRKFEDFKHVIDVKVAEWLHSPKMNKFLRPETLFTPGNFESYLNQSIELTLADGGWKNNSSGNGGFDSEAFLAELKEE